MGLSNDEVNAILRLRTLPETSLLPAGFLAILEV